MILHENEKHLVVASIHWGFSPGGIAKYAEVINDVGRYAPIDVKTICISGKNWDCDTKTLTKLNPVKIYIKSRIDPAWIWKVRAAVAKINPDIILTHGFNAHFVALLTRFLSLRSYPLICSYHSRYHPSTITRRLFPRVIDEFTSFYLRHKAAGIVCVSDYSKRDLTRRGVNSQKIVVIHNGIPAAISFKEDDRIRLRREWNIADNSILIGTSGRLDPIKGITHLIDAFSSIRKKGINARLVIIGTGPLEETLKQQVQDLGLAGFTSFAGFRTDVNECLAALDIYVLPSLDENHSIALLEAMRGGKAIVATNVGGNTESVTHDKEALIVAPANTEMLTAAIIELANNPAMRMKLGENAFRRFNEEFTSENMVRKTATWMLSFSPQHQGIRCP